MIKMPMFRRTNNGNNQNVFTINRSTCFKNALCRNAIRLLPKTSYRKSNTRIIVQRSRTIYRYLRKVRDKVRRGIYPKGLTLCNVNGARRRQITKDRCGSKIIHHHLFRTNGCFFVAKGSTIRQCNSKGPFNPNERREASGLLVPCTAKRSLPLPCLYRYFQ